MIAGHHFSASSDQHRSYRLVGPFADPALEPMDLSGPGSLNQIAPIELSGADLSNLPVPLAALAPGATETTNRVGGPALPDDVSRPRLSVLPSPGADQAERSLPAQLAPETALDPPRACSTGSRQRSAGIPLSRIRRSSLWVKISKSTPGQIRSSRLALFPWLNRKSRFVRLFPDSPSLRTRCSKKLECNPFLPRFRTLTFVRTRLAKPFCWPPFQTC